MSNTTLKKISEALGLSISTISRALKNHPDISEKTKLRVNELAKALDYEPNANAINLRSSKSNLFGLIVPSISNLFYDSFIASVEEELRKSNYSLMILQSGENPEIEMENLKLCRQNRVSGLFICLTSQTNVMDPFIKLTELDIPVLFFDKVPNEENFIKVCVADTVAATMAANAILKKEKKKILALFGDSNLSITKKRLEAFSKTIGNKATILSHHARSAEEAEKITLKLLKEKPDVVFCMSDEILTGAMKAIQKSGLKIPTEIAVIAISNGFIPTLYFPEITYVETSGYKLGKLAYSSMMACMEGRTLMKELTTEAILVEGGSL